MNLSPKAIRFIIEALEHYQTSHEERLHELPPYVTLSASYGNRLEVLFRLFPVTWDVVECPKAPVRSKYPNALLYRKL